MPSVTSNFMRSKGRTRSNNQVNNRTATLERMYVRVLSELCMNRFKYTGLEGTGIDARYLELQLFERALAVVFQHNDVLDPSGEVVTPGTGKIVALAGSPVGAENFIGNYTKFQVYGSRFMNRTLPIAECVPIWANYLRAPDLDIVFIYANKLAEIDRTIEINVKNARIAKGLIADDNTRLTAANVNDAIERGESVIKITRDITANIIPIDLGVDVKGIESLHITRQKYWNECMALLGINNANQDKKERLVESEVSANDDQVLTVQRVNLNARQEGIRQVNEMFGTDITVDYFGAITEADMPMIEEVA